MKQSVAALLYMVLLVALFGGATVRAQDVPSDDDPGASGSTLLVAGPVANLGTNTFDVREISLTVTETTSYEGIAGFAELTDGMHVKVDYVVTPDGVSEAQRVERTSDETAEPGEDEEGGEDEESGEDEEEGEEENEEEEGGEEDAEDGEESDITAVVQEVGTGYLVVGELTIGVDASTRLEGFVELTELLHQVVEVEYVTHADGTHTATRIKLEAAEDEGEGEDEAEDEVEAEGLITAVSEASVEVDGVAFAVTDRTVIRERGERLTVAELHVGDKVEVEGIRLEDGTLEARRLRVKRVAGGEEALEVKGALQSVSVADRQIGVAGRVLVVAEEAEIEDAEGQPITLADLAVRDVVEVTARREADGVLTATKVEVRRQLHHEGTFVGVVTGLPAGGVEVDGVLFLVADATILADGLVLAELAGGEHLKVRFRRLADGGRLAMKVKRLGSDDERSFTGIVDAVEGSTLTVSGVAVTLTETTEIEGTDGEPATAEALAVGQTVEVELVEGTQDAAKIEIKVAVVLSGAVETSTAGTLVVAGNEIVLLDETLILGSESGELTADALTSGLPIEVLAIFEVASSAGKVASGRFVAERVYVQELSGTTSTEASPHASLPANFVIEQNYPNPFNPTTTIPFSVSGSAPEAVSLTIYNAAGQEVRTLFRGTLSPGRYTYSWDGRTNAGEAAASGLYLYRLRVGSHEAARPMMLTK